jgi:FAD/FMN-containing dehydrogenase
MKVIKAYHLHEWVGVMPYEAAAEIESEMTKKYRHFGYFWCSTRASAKWLGLSIDKDPESFDDCAYVRIFDPNPIDVGELSRYEYSRRYDRSYRIYPEVYTPDFHEMEYMVPLESGQQCFRELKRALRDQFDFLTIPAEMRFTAGDDNYLSEYYGGARAAISVSGRMHKEDLDFFRGCDEIFSKYDGRSHWGKIHFLTRERLERVYPRHGDFVSVRREMDPEGLFLNDYLQPLFG